MCTCIVMFTKCDSELKLSTHWVMYQNAKRASRVSRKKSFVLPQTPTSRQNYIYI